MHAVANLRVPLPPHAEAWEGDEEDDDDDIHPMPPPSYMQSRVISPRTPAVPVGPPSGLASLTVDQSTDHELVATAVRTMQAIHAAAGDEQNLAPCITAPAVPHNVPTALHLSRMARKLWEYQQARPGMLLTTA